MAGLSLSQDDLAVDEVISAVSVNVLLNDPLQTFCVPLILLVLVGLIDCPLGLIVKVPYFRLMGKQVVDERDETRRSGLLKNTLPVDFLRWGFTGENLTLSSRVAWMIVGGLKLSVVWLRSLMFIFG